MFGITPKNQYRPAISMPTSNKATPAITEILDSCRAVLERLRADSMSPLAMALRDSLAFMIAKIPVGQKQHMVTKIALFM